MSVKRSLISGLTLAVMALGVTLIAATGAQAKYTAIDEIPVLDSNGNPVIDPNTGLKVTQPVILNFGGYCDSQFGVGDDCGSTYTLPYTVIFGGEETNQLLLRDDGILDFVGDLLASPPDSTHLFNVLGSVDTGIAGPGFPPQLATLQFQGPSILATWFTCITPLACYQDQHTALLTPGANGFDITYTGGGTGPNFLTAAFNPAQGVPEPAAWALMILGFGAAGAALRRRGFRVA